MKGILKKLGIAYLVKEAVERVNEARKPEPTLMGRLSKPLMLLGIGGAGFWAYRSGKLNPVMEKIGGGSDSGSPSGYHGATTTGTYGSGTTGTDGGSTASIPAASTGTTSVGTASTTTNV